MTPAWMAALVLAATAVAAAPAAALELPLSPAGRLAAVEAGRRMALAEGGYPVRDYLLFETDDALAMQPGAGEIYAVTLRTPFERARWNSYTQARQGRPATEAADAQPAETLDLVVYVRSTEARGRDVLERISVPVLTLASGDRLEPWAIERSRPFRGSQMAVRADGQARPAERWFGTIAYRFQLAASDAGPLSFEIVDGTGRTYRLQADLAHLR